MEIRIADKNDIELMMSSSLDATEAGRPLYKKCGFEDSGECMVLVKGKLQ